MKLQTQSIDGKIMHSVRCNCYSFIKQMKLASMQKPLGTISCQVFVSYLQLELRQPHLRGAAVFMRLVDILCQKEYNYFYKNGRINRATESVPVRPSTA